MFFVLDRNEERTKPAQPPVVCKLWPCVESTALWVLARRGKEQPNLPAKAVGVEVIRGLRQLHRDVVGIYRTLRLS